MSTASVITEFEVEAFFQNGKGIVNQEHGDFFTRNFMEHYYFHKIKIDFTGIGPVVPYELEESLQNHQLQNKLGRRFFLTTEQLFLVLFALIIKPELGKKFLNYELSKDKYYIFHVYNWDFGDVHIRWYEKDNLWWIEGGSFLPNEWNEGGVFLSFETDLVGKQR